MEFEQSFCLFDGDAGPMAVSLESVVAVLDAEPLVRLAWSPPQVVGLCPYHREVVPVVSIGPAASNRREDRQNGAHLRADTVSEQPTANDEDQQETRCNLLILRTDHDAWALRIGRAGTSISRECPDYHLPRLREPGAVLIGALGRGEHRYAVFDAAGTWRELRARIARWYGLINDPNLCSSLLVE